MGSSAHQQQQQSAEGKGAIEAKAAPSAAYQRRACRAKYDSRCRHAVRGTGNEGDLPAFGNCMAAEMPQSDMQHLQA